MADKSDEKRVLLGGGIVEGSIIVAVFTSSSGSLREKGSSACHVSSSVCGGSGSGGSSAGGSRVGDLGGAGFRL